ncbi:hypothetical protein CA13_07250 [Planctomycetes bacterium CA13]|uniref:Uncharacterized protein n=1 Tax=Novipirellula herctigrandis TaxID=2527986 RepID=A0A5C5YX18_9BACT|nr:hypothetical protein CA13_07250 [Planctomycetes bacterium CA13]
MAPSFSLLLFLYSLFFISIENLSFTRRFVITLLKQDTSKSSLKSKRKAAGWNTDFLEKLLFGA